MRQQIGKLNKNVIQLLGLSVPCNTPIYISDTNILHMQTSHPADYQKYGNDIRTILKFPDYVGINPKDNSIEFANEYVINGEYVKVAVRVSASNIYYARSLYVLNPIRVKNYIAKGYLKKL